MYIKLIYISKSWSSYCYKLLFKVTQMPTILYLTWRCCNQMGMPRDPSSRIEYTSCSFSLSEKRGRGLAEARQPALRQTQGYFSFSSAHRKRLTWLGCHFIISAHSVYWDSIITPYVLFNCSQFFIFFFFKLHARPSLRDRISLACFSTHTILNSPHVITSHFGSFL